MFLWMPPSESWNPPVLFPPYHPVFPCCHWQHAKNTWSIFTSLHVHNCHYMCTPHKYVYMCTIVFTYVHTILLHNCVITMWHNSSLPHDIYASLSLYSYCWVISKSALSSKDPQSTNWPVQAEFLEQMHLLCPFEGVSYEDVANVILLLYLYFSYTVFVFLLCICIALCGVCVGVLWVRVMKTSPLAPAPFLFITQVGPPGWGENNWKLKLIFFIDFYFFVF